MNSKIDIIKYMTTGVCAKMITVAIKDNKIVDIDFLGGCDGNLRAISILINGMEIDEVIQKLEGVHCGGKPTSCTDQLAKALIEYKANKLVTQS